MSPLTRSAPPLGPIGAWCGIGAGSLLVIGGVLTAIAIELDIRSGLDFLTTVADHREVWIVAAVCIAAAQPLLAPFLAALWNGHPHPGSWTAVGVGLVGVAGVLQLTSAVVNVPLGAAVAPESVDRSDPSLGIALHDVADGLFFAANALAGLGALALVVGWPSRWLRALAGLAAAANLAVFAGFAVEALWPVGAAGYLAVAAVWVTMGAKLLATGHAPGRAVA